MKIAKSAALISGTLIASLAAQEAEVTENEGIEMLETVTVLGSQEDFRKLPGSGYLIETEAIREQNQSNINRLLARVPGVYVREEDGYGNFPNISLRGGDGTRSEKVTIMEDGILSAPAPYSAPSAYYSPRAARMSGIEILKGSSQIQYGPNTTGGVINYLSTLVPEEETFYTRNTYGTDNTILSHSYYGNTHEGNYGRFGYILELFHQSTDGFREIEPGAGYGGSDDTGFTTIEPMLKLFWEPNSALKQRFEFKYGFADLDTDESYTGLAEGLNGTPNHLHSRPDLRYAATRFDNIQTEQHRTYLKHRIHFNENFNVESAIYYNSFERNWRKLDGVLDAPNGSTSVRAALANDLDLLRGRGPGSLVIRNNAREYESYGVQVQGEYSLDSGAVSQTFSAGIRYHEDYVERDQFDEIYDQGATGAINGQRYRLNNVRRQESEALSLWLKDEIKVGNLTVTPGVRLEMIDYSQRDFSEDKGIVNTLGELAANRAAVTSTDTSGDLEEFVPGVSFNYEMNDEQSLFGGVHKGISVPSPRSAISGSSVEESIGYELGFRHESESFSAEFAGFLTDFDNLLGVTAGTGAGAVQRDSGEAEVYGFEGQLAYDPLIGGEYSMPMYVSATWTSAEFQNTVTGGGGDNIYSGATPGSEIPYIPEWKLAFGVGFKTDVWGVNLDATFTSETFGTGANLDATNPANPRQGKIDEMFLIDFSTHYRVSENVKLIGGIENLFDERGVVSRIPRGPRNNNGRTAFIGFEAKF